MYPYVFSKIYLTFVYILCCVYTLCTDIHVSFRLYLGLKITALWRHMIQLPCLIIFYNLYIWMTVCPSVCLVVFYLRFRYISSLMAYWLKGAFYASLLAISLMVEKLYRFNITNILYMIKHFFVSLNCYIFLPLSLFFDPHISLSYIICTKVLGLSTHFYCCSIYMIVPFICD